MCNKFSCTYENPPQIASGIFNCQGTDKYNRKCTGTYYITQREAKIHERVVRGRLEAAHAAEIRRKEEERVLNEKLKRYREERDVLRGVLNAWYRGDDKTVVKYAKSINRSGLMNGDKGAWLRLIQEVKQREAALSEWLGKHGGTNVEQKPFAR